MKKIVIFAACLWGMVACKKDAGYTITGHIDGVKDGVLVVLENGAQPLDTAVVKGGVFCLEGKSNEPFYATISIEQKEDGWGGKAFNLFVENADIRIEGDWEKLYESRITGSELQKQYEVFEKQLDTLYEERTPLDVKMWEVYAGPLYEGGFTEACIAPGIEIAKQKEVVEQKIDRYCLDFVRQHPDSPVALQVLGKVISKRYTEQEMNDMLALLSPELKATDAYRELQEKVKSVTKFAPGKDFVDFKVVDVNGKEGMFSDYVKPGKYNMLEVWASWCGHCRVEIPHLKMVQEKYGDRFNIIAVSWDKDEAEWRKAMKEENAPYLQLRAVKDENGQDVGTAYGLHGIPFSLVIDGEGKIVTEEARAAALDMLLQELYGE